MTHMWLVDLTHPSLQWSVRQVSMSDVDEFAVDLLESARALTSGTIRPRYTVCFFTSEAEAASFSEKLTRILPQPTLPWNEGHFAIVLQVQKMVLDEHQARKAVPPVEPKPKAAKAKAKPTAKKGDKAAAAAPADPPKSPEWQEKEAKHQQTLAKAVAHLDERIAFSHGLRREYFEEARKAFVGRPHDDPLWQFILGTHNSLDDTLETQEALDFMRHINAGKPLTLISGQPLE